ncbi:hypothetical protein HELRODRAFT_192553 [Helobdella robusta]|uniref:Protein kinase SIK1/2/3 UBA domain-containing protein n=1 Tax=Helobdella robusta TaxID=6412 RepID=T1FU26_HELRO|nr:hypothetical protein HELRODRAFT_192553 [Helobdella robusta]ESO00627.1 hypothetical protein HELRODRAFT_192553 [Helobdella robusta]
MKPKLLPVECEKLIRRLLCTDVSKRISMKDIISHEWMKLGGDDPEYDRLIEMSLDPLVTSDVPLCPMIINQMVQNYGLTKVEIMKSLLSKKFDNTSAMYNLLYDKYNRTSSGGSVLRPNKQDRRSSINADRVEKDADQRDAKLTKSSPLDDMTRYLAMRRHTVDTSLGNDQAGIDDKAKTKLGVKELKQSGHLALASSSHNHNHHQHHHHQVRHGNGHSSNNAIVGTDSSGNSIGVSSSVMSGSSSSSGANGVTGNYKKKNSLSPNVLNDTQKKLQVLSRIDYCNSLYYGLPDSILYPLSKAFNSAARLGARAPFFSHLSPYLVLLPWIPIILPPTAFGNSSRDSLKTDHKTSHLLSPLANILGLSSPRRASEMIMPSGKQQSKLEKLYNRAISGEPQGGSSSGALRSMPQENRKLVRQGGVQNFEKLSDFNRPTGLVKPAITDLAINALISSIPKCSMPSLKKSFPSLDEEEDGEEECITSL